jgi:deazaflavin-dependent oxidoreductase (nitroreductase family)
VLLLHSRADRQTRGQRAVRVVAVVLLGVGAAVVGVYSLLPRVARQNWDRLRRSHTMMCVLKWVNRNRLKSAGSKRSATAILTHVGRRSGRTYETPLGAYAYGDGFVLSLAYGSQTDWCRNVMAAGTCRLAWKGHTYELERPEIISGPEVMQTWPAWERIVLRTVGIHEFLWLHHAKEQVGPSQQVEPLVEHGAP